MKRDGGRGRGPTTAALLLGALALAACGNDGSAAVAPAAPSGTAGTTSGASPAPSTTVRRQATAWSQEALARADALLSAVRGDAHTEAAQAVYPVTPAEAAPATARIVLVGGPAGHVDDSLTLLELGRGSAWVVRAAAAHERVDQTAGGAPVARCHAVSVADLERAVETARILLRTTFRRRTDGPGHRTSGPDAHLFAVRVELDDRTAYDRCPATEALVDGVREDRAVLHEALFRLFAELVDDAEPTGEPDPARWGGWLDTALGTVTPRDADGDRAGPGRLAHALVRHAAWDGGPGAAEALTRLGRREAAQRARLRTDFDPDWAERFLSGRYAHDRDERRLEPAVRSAFFDAQPARYRAFLVREVADLEGDAAARAEVAAELARRFGTDARDDLAPLLADDDEGVRAATALGLLEAAPDAPEARAALDAIARSPESAEPTWRGFEESPRRLVLERLVTDPKLFPTARLEEQLDVVGEDPRIVTRVLEELEKRGRTVDAARRIALHRRALGETVQCGTLHAVERLVTLDDQESIAAMKRTLTALARWRTPVRWSPIDASAFRNERMRVEQVFWDWVAARPTR